MAFDENAERSEPPLKSVVRPAAFGLAVGIPASLVFLWLAFRSANVEVVWTAASGADRFLVGLAAVSIGVVYVFQAMR